MSEKKARTISSIYADHIINFIAMKRRLGYQFKTEATILSSFDRYLKELDYQGPLTQDLALSFASSSPQTSAHWHARKYRVVQQFSLYLSLTAPDMFPLPAMKPAMDKSLRSIFADHIANFNEMRKQVGYRSAGHRAILFHFDRYLCEIGYDGPLTPELALDFAASKFDLSKNQCSRRYQMVQQFSCYLAATVPGTSPISVRPKAVKNRLDRTLRSIFAGHIANYVEMKKRLGYRFEDQEVILLHFDRFLYERNYQGALTQELALNFATSKPRMSKNECARKYQVIRQFSDYLAVSIPDTPPLHPRALIRSKGRPAAHIYTDEEMTRLMSAPSGLRGSIPCATSRFMRWSGLSQAAVCGSARW